MAQFTLNDLAALIAARASASAGASYTKTLLDKGPAYAARKFGEEAVEAIVAAVEGDRPGLTNEAADVVYHLLVVLQTRGIAWQSVVDELERRTTQSGHAEKAARPAHE